jgi:S-adenosylmethionine hydrolase
VITLTTDFGLDAPFVGIMKGVILARLPQARIIDLTHQIEPYWPAEAGFWLARAYGWFARGTVHVAVVDPGVGTARGILGAAAAGHVFLAPDNGLLAPLLAAHPQALVVRLGEGVSTRLGVTQVSSTFHGRDLFCPAAAELAAGRCTLTDLGEPVTAWAASAVGPPSTAGAQIDGVVIAIDRYGNLISNIDAALLTGLDSPLVWAAGRALRLARTYGDVARGELLALINSSGVVEVAVREGSAAAVLGMARGAPVTVQDGARIAGAPGR